MRRMVLSLGLCLLSCGEEDAPPRDVDPDAAAELDLDLVERFSPPRYDAVAAEAVPLHAAAQRALDAYATTTLIAQEVDLFEDDWIERDAALVFLGRDGGRLVGLTTRYAVDLRYPDPKLVTDGFGAAEIGMQTLSVGGDAPVELVRPGVERPDTATVRLFDDHDVALVYLPDQPQRATLGLEDPGGAVLDHLEDASALYGLELTLVSPASMAALRNGVTVRSSGGRLLVMGAALALDPLLGSVLGAPDLIDPAIMDQLGSAIANISVAQIEEWTGPLMDRFEMYGPSGTSPEPEPIPRPRAKALHAVDRLVLDEEGWVVLDDGRSLPWRGLDMIDPRAPEAIEALVDGAEVIVSELDSGQAIVLVPQRRLVLNIELACHGLADGEC